MRKQYCIILITILSVEFFITGCYEDNSTYPASSIDEIVISDAGFGEAIRIGYLEELKLAPDITKGDNKNNGNLQYEWTITVIASSTVPELEVVGTEKDLDIIVNRSVSFAPYSIQLTVTDNDHGGLQYFRIWKMYVRSTFTDGLVISDTHDGQTSDFTYIKNKDLTINYTDEEKMYRNILKDASGSPYDGLLSSLTYEVQGYTTSTLEHTNQIWALTPTGYCTRFDCSDFSENGNSDSESLLTYKPEGFQFYRFFKGYQMFFAISNQGIYSCFIVDNSFGWYDPLIKDAIISNNVVVATSSTRATYNHTVFLDKRDGIFKSYNDQSPISSLTTYVPNSVFDPNAMQEKTVVAAGIAEDATVSTFLLKDDNSGEYAIYTLLQYQSPEKPSSAGNMYTIPLEGKNLIDRAVSLFFAQKELVLYVATEEGIYAVTYGSGPAAVVNTTAKFAPAGEKITNAKLYQQGHYVNDNSTVTGSNPKYAALPWNNRAVMVASQTGEFDGKVYIIPITQPGIGTLDPSQGLAYDGFGKVLDMITIGY